MLHEIRSLALSACALALGLAAAPAEAASVRPHVFEGGITLVDIAHENLDPWGFYDGTKGLPVPAPASASGAGTPVAAGPGQGGWIAAAGWSVPQGGGDPNFAPLPAPAGFPRGKPGPCYWDDDRFGSAGNRDRCGHPVPGPGTASPPPAFTPRPQPVVLIPYPSGDPVAPAPAPVPLPATGWLLGAAVIASLWRQRR